MTASSICARPDAEYVLAATVWPWELPPGFAFPKNRGIPDTPGHWNGMCVRDAFSMWKTAILDAVKDGDLSWNIPLRLPMVQL